MLTMLNLHQMLTLVKATEGRGNRREPWEEQQSKFSLSVLWKPSNLVSLKMQKSCACICSLKPVFCLEYALYYMYLTTP